MPRAFLQLEGLEEAVDLLGPDHRTGVRDGDESLVALDPGEIVTLPPGTLQRTALSSRRAQHQKAQRKRSRSSALWLKLGGSEEVINVPIQPDPQPVPGPKGWNVKIPGQAIPEGTYPTHGEAERAARETVRQEGGGEGRNHRPDGTIRNSDTVAPDNDPRRSHDTKR